MPRNNPETEELSSTTADACDLSYYKSCFCSISYALICINLLFVNDAVRGSDDFKAGGRDVLCRTVRVFACLRNDAVL